MAKAKPCRQEGKGRGTSSHQGPTIHMEPSHPLPEPAVPRGPLPETSGRSSQLRCMGSVRLFRIKAVISLTWKCVRVTPVPDGPELERDLKKKALLQFPVQTPGNFTRVLHALCQSTSTLINFIPLVPAVITASRVPQRHTAVLQHLSKTLTRPILPTDPPSRTSKHQKQEHQLSH